MPISLKTIVGEMLIRVALYAMLLIGGTCFAASTKLEVDSGHAHRVGSIEVSKDGKLVASVDYFGKVIVRERESGVPLAVFRVGEGAVTMGGNLPGGSIDFSPDNKFFLVGRTSDEDVGVVDVYYTSNFAKFASIDAHGTAITDPRGLSLVQFINNREFITISARDSERSPDVRVARRWTLSEGRIFPSKDQTLTPYVTRDPRFGARWSENDVIDSDLPEKIRSTSKNSCKTEAHSGLSIALDGLYKWNRDGGLTRLWSLDVSLNAFSIYCDASSQSAWILSGKRGDPMRDEWLTDKTLYFWSNRTSQLTRVAYLGREQFEEAAIVPGHDELIASIGRNILRIDSKGDIRRYPTSSGGVQELTLLPDGSSLAVVTRYSLFLGGEYMPETYPQSVKVMNLMTGRQDYFSIDADCPLIGSVVVECSPFSGGYSYKRHAFRSLRNLGEINIPTNLKEKGFAPDDVVDWSWDEGQIRLRKESSGSDDNEFVYHIASRQLRPLKIEEGESASPLFSYLASEAGDKVYSILDRRPLASWPIPKGSSDSFLHFAKENESLFLVSREYEEHKFFKDFIVRQVQGQEVGRVRVTTKGDVLASLSMDGSMICLADVTNERTVLQVVDTRRVTTSVKKELSPIGQLSAIACLRDGVALGTTDGVVHILDFKGTEVVTHFSFAEGGWVSITPEGYFLSSNEDVVTRLWGVSASGHRFRLASLSERFFRPDVVAAALSRKSLGQAMMKSLDTVGPAPEVTLLDAKTTVATDEAKLLIKITDRGGGVGNVRVHVNGSAVKDSTVAQLRRVGSDSYELVIGLADGENDVRVVALNAESTMKSSPATVRLRSSRTSSERPRLVALVIGTNDFENPRYSLKYAEADATAVAKSLKRLDRRLYSDIVVTELIGGKRTTKRQLLDALAEMRELKATDVFLLYVATHGVVEGNDLASREYFLFSSDVGGTGEGALRSTAVSQLELKDALSNIPANKKMVIIDACHSGAFGDPSARSARGLSEEAAVRVLSSTVGAIAYFAATSNQEALEGVDGHGVFTKVLLDGLSGLADKRGRGYVSTVDLGTYLQDEVASIAKSRLGRRQYPSYHLSGQDFPVNMSR